MAVKFLKNENEEYIKNICRQVALEADGNYDFFVKRAGGQHQLGYRRRSFRGFLKEGVSLFAIAEQQRAQAWEKRVGYTRD
jgi:hypothetical protein